MKLCVAIAVWLGLALSAQGQTAFRSDRVVKILVPEDVARAAHSVRSGPLLVLEGVEVGAGEGLTVLVLNRGEVIGTVGMVGRRQVEPVGPMRKFTLLALLNERGRAAVAGGGELELTLRLLRNEDRVPLVVDKVYLRRGDRH